ncbi:ParA family protein [Pseudomonas savastanoi]|uniref:ParA family protein n=1 Tax=Pseudomonas savastanoi TaxID=29438 RepID=UPI001E4803DE|nr:AAA family ATPase [Pseudomonas savastanoi]UFI44008.1 AAA family ATPase [Pseudomonas savastanoi]
MDTRQRELLRQLRLKARISVKLAAQWAQVKERTWRAWESPEDSSTARSPSRAALWSFFARSGLRMLEELKPNAGSNPLGIAFSISSYKGGVGKSPITINVAACLIEFGYKVAIVTNDGVYRAACHLGRSPAPGTLVSQIDFYDEFDLITAPGEVKEIRKQIRDNASLASPEDKALAQFLFDGSIAALRRKEKATETLEDLIGRYDYVLIDFNKNVDVIRRHAQLVAIVVDSNCLMSVDSARAFVAALRRVDCRETTPSYFGLLTNCDVGGVSSELEEFIGDIEDLGEEKAESLLYVKYNICRRREMILREIEALPFPPLTTELTSAYKIAIEMFNENKPMNDQYGYFNSVLDCAPRSHASRDIRRLTDELINCRL